ncbi:MAG: lipase [Jaaginema sp. PMC 1079.18]|nr:lipase [Jaaginema sp. PMC 1080.18]MEC4850408.1 lipase [Jaaginema sp. PMC 1079.18]MEC4864744.1 lipase [Jaaginema sp. PMC 1078.18]
MPLPSVILPGYFARGTEYHLLEKALNERGIPTVTVPIRKRDWIPTLGGRSIVPILRQIERTVAAVRETYHCDRLNLIGHSAGGWIARIYLGDRPYDIHGDVTGKAAVWQGRQGVARLITLGTPHISQERWTKRNLDFVKDSYPGAFYPEIQYICVAGKAVYGQPWQNWLAYNSYRLTCGEGNCWGDGITPIPAAHLDGAINLTLDGVWHSPNSPGRWYGSPEVLGLWVQYLLANSAAEHDAI